MSSEPFHLPIKVDLVHLVKLIKGRLYLRKLIKTVAVNKSTL